MAITLAVSPTMKPVPGVDRRLPITEWTGFGQSTGDVTGGEHLIIISLPSKGNVLYSVEEFSARHSTVANDVGVELNSQELGPGGSVYAWQVAFNMVIILAGSNAHPITRRTRIWKIFQPSADGQLRFNTLNVNLNVFTVSSWGYVWDSEALRLSGGPVRPGQVALYSTKALR